MAEIFCNLPCWFSSPVLGCLENSLCCRTMERQRHVSGKPKSPPARLLTIDKGILLQFCLDRNSNSVILGTPTSMITKSGSTSEILTDFLASQASKTAVLVLTSIFPHCQPAFYSPCSYSCISTVNTHVYYIIYLPKLTSYKRMHHYMFFVS